MTEEQTISYDRRVQACSTLRQSAHFELWLLENVLTPLEEAERVLHALESTDAQLRAANIAAHLLTQQRDWIAENEAFAKDKLNR